MNEITSFLDCLSKSEADLHKYGGVSEMLKRRKVTHVKIGEVRYEKASEVSRKAKAVVGRVRELLSGDPALESAFRTTGDTIELDPKYLGIPKEAVQQIISLAHNLEKSSLEPEEKTDSLLSLLSNSCPKLAARNPSNWGKHRKNLSDALLKLSPKIGLSKEQIDRALEAGTDKFGLEGETVLSELVHTLLNDRVEKYSKTK